MRKEGIDCVLDVGANAGHFGAELRERGYKGRIVSFEPVASVFERLNDRVRADPGWDAYRLGVGAEAGRLEISVSEADVFSSFKPISAYTAAKFTGARERSREQVQVTRLDQFLKEHVDYLTPTSKTYLKIDTQGFEKEVLVGAGKALASFAAVQLELPLRPLYEGQDDWLDMIAWMAERGFEVAMARENGFDWQACRLLELDVVFTRRG